MSSPVTICLVLACVVGATIAVDTLLVPANDAAGMKPSVNDDSDDYNYSCGESSSGHAIPEPDAFPFYAHAYAGNQCNQLTVLTNTSCFQSYWQVRRRS